jgi:hypothetical protein
MGGMQSVLIALLISASAPAGPADAGVPASVDLDCFRLMAELAGDTDPRIRSMGTVGAQYFLGRIDAAAPGFDVDRTMNRATGDREALLRRCGEVLRAGGRDFRDIGESLAMRGRPQA